MMVHLMVQFLLKYFCDSATRWSHGKNTFYLNVYFKKTHKNLEFSIKSLFH